MKQRLPDPSNCFTLNSTMYIAPFIRLLSATSSKVSFALLLVTLFCTCDSAQTPQAAAGETTTVRQPNTDESTVEPVVYPSIALERLEYIFENATYLDATFYELPISINQNQSGPIRSTIGGIAASPMELYPTCQPLGHIWFQVDGKNIEEADIYFGGKCVGYVWYETGKPAYSNTLTKEGMNFYFNILQSVQQNQNGNQ